MNEKLRDTLQYFARRIQLSGIAISIIAGGAAGGAFALDVRGAWGLAFSSFLTSLCVGMVAVLVSAISERVAPGDWRAGLRLSSRIFFSQATLYTGALLGLMALVRIAETSVNMPQLPGLLLQMAPGLYLASVMAVLLSAPLYLRWIPVPGERI